MVTPAGSKVDATGYPGAWTEFLAWLPDEAAIEQAVVTPPRIYRQTVRPDLRG